MKKTLSLSCAGILISTALFTLAVAQTQREIVTNAKIIELVRIGLDEDIIVEKIRQSECQCDTSTDALAKLKAGKVSNAVILAMMNAVSGTKTYSENGPPSPNGRSTRVVGDQTEPGMELLRQMPEPGIYLSADGNLTAIEPTVYSGSKSSFLGTALTYGIKKTKIRAVIRGKSANLQVKTARPEFYFLFSREFGNAGAVMSGIAGYSATSPNEFMMISMKVKENSREATLGEIGAFSASTGASDKEIREFNFEKIRPGLYKVTPKADLTAGEYCFYYAGNGGAGSKVFDFGVGH